MPEAVNLAPTEYSVPVHRESEALAALHLSTFVSHHFGMFSGISTLRTEISPPITDTGLQAEWILHTVGRDGDGRRTITRCVGKRGRSQNESTPETRR